MNIIELIATGFLTIWLYLVIRRRHILSWRVFFTMVCGITVLFLAFDHSTQFLSVDETYNFWQRVSIATAKMAHWETGASRTSVAIQGTIIHGLRIITRLPFVYYVMFAKALQATMGLVLAGWLMTTLHNRYFSKHNNYFFEPIFLIMCGLLPVFQLAIRILNPDLISMTLGAMAVINCGIGLENKSPKLKLLAVGLAYLATQEKLIAAPILWLCILVYGWSSVEETTVHYIGKWSLKFISRISVAIGLTILLAGISYAILWINRYYSLPVESNNLHSFFQPMFVVIWPLMRMLGSDLFIKNFSLLGKNHPFFWLFISICVIGFGIFLFILLTWIISHLLKTKPWLKQKMKQTTYNLWWIGSCVFLLIWMILFLTQSSIVSYSNPPDLISPNMYHPAVSFNGKTLFFGALSRTSHILYYLRWAYFQFIFGIPTVIVVAIASILIWQVWKREYKEPTHLSLNLIYIGTLLVPAGYAIANIPIGPRYLNVFIFLFCIVVAVKASLILAELRPNIGWTITIIFLVSITAEVLPFSPIYGSFFPVWYKIPKATKDNPILTPNRPFWKGWGEEAMLAGEWLIKNEFGGEPPKHPTIIWINYFGDWLVKPANVEINSMLSDNAKPTYTAHDYFVINRAGLYISCGHVPEYIKPLGKLRVRGLTTAWIYRGDLLTKAGFEFESCEKCW